MNNRVYQICELLSKKFIHVYLLQRITAEIQKIIFSAASRNFEKGVAYSTGLSQIVPIKIIVGTFE